MCLCYSKMTYSKQVKIKNKTKHNKNKLKKKQILDQFVHLHSFCNVQSLSLGLKRGMVRSSMGCQ